MTVLKLTRDEARMIERNFMPYMVMLAVAKMHEALYTYEAATAPFRNITFVNCKIALSLIHDVQKAFKQRLLTDGKNFTFKLTDAHGIALYHFLMNHPIDQSHVYANLLRQRICDDLHKQFLQPVPAAEEDVEIY